MKKLIVTCFMKKLIVTCFMSEEANCDVFYEEENCDVFYEEAICDVPGGLSDRIVQRTAYLWLLSQAERGRGHVCDNALFSALPYGEWGHLCSKASIQCRSACSCGAILCCAPCLLVHSLIAFCLEYTVCVCVCVCVSVCARACACAFV